MFEIKVNFAEMFGTDTKYLVIISNEVIEEDEWIKVYDESQNEANAHAITGYPKGNEWVTVVEIDMLSYKSGTTIECELSDSVMEYLAIGALKRNITINDFAVEIIRRYTGEGVTS